jgi:hypothetical protein
MMRNVEKVLAEYDSRYEGKSKIYATEITELLERSTDSFDLLWSCIRYGYVLGRRAEKNARYNKRNRNI